MSKSHWIRPLQRPCQAKIKSISTTTAEYLHQFTPTIMHYAMCRDKEPPRNVKKRERDGKIGSKNENEKWKMKKNWKKLVGISTC